MSSPFEQPGAPYEVLRNDEGQHSLWPVFAPAPDGWVSVYGPAGRDECLAYVREHWVELRPRSVTEFIQAHSN